jgi:hypothetical protein
MKLLQLHDGFISLNPADDIRQGSSIAEGVAVLVSSYAEMWEQ